MKTLALDEDQIKCLAAIRDSKELPMNIDCLSTGFIRDNTDTDMAKIVLVSALWNEEELIRI